VLTARLRRIGSSDAPAIAGLSPYCTPFAAWLRITGRSESPPTDATEMGHALEEPLLQLAARREGWAIVQSGDTIQAPDGWRQATPDFYVRADGDAIVECKNVGHRMLREWDGGPPDYVVAQVQWQLDITGLSRAFIVAALGGTGPHVFPVAADPDLQRGLYVTASAFYGSYIATDTPPPVDGSDAARAYFSGKWRDHRPELKGATEAIEATALRLKEQVHLQALLTEQIEAQKNELRAYIAEAAGVELEDGRITWKRAKDSKRIDWEAVASYLFTAYGVNLETRSHLMEVYTHVIDGSRRLILPRAWGKGGD
jgi:predicted phage-related endonuclease